MYNQTAQNQTYRRDGRSAPSRSGGRRSERGRGQERTRLLQLLVCLALFLAVFVGKGVFPHRLEEVRESLLTLLTANTDFRGAFFPHRRVSVRGGRRTGGSGGVLCGGFWAKPARGRPG